MQLSKTQAIDKTIETWERLADTGKTDKGRCYLCLYVAKPGGGSCGRCPWYKYLGRCEGNNSPYISWYCAKTPRSRKIWANRCLERLYAIQELECSHAKG